MNDRWVWRSRWAALGAAVAVSIGGGGFFLASAAPGPSESTIVAVTPTAPVLDTRNPVDLGLAGPFVSPVSQKLQITGSVPTSAGPATVVPPGATGVLLNVTAVGPAANGYISVRPGDAAGTPATSSLNVEAGSNLPNAVQVALPTAGANAGQIDITYDAYGTPGPTTELLVDIVGYTTSAGLQQLVADVAAKANAADVYNRAQVDAGFVAKGDIVMSNGLMLWRNAGSAPTLVENYLDATRVSGGNGIAQVELDGPLQLGATVFGLRSVTYCIRTANGAAFVTQVQVRGSTPPDVANVSDTTNRTAAGCYTMAVNNSTSTSFTVAWTFAGGGGFVDFTSVTSTWAPASAWTSLPPSRAMTQRAMTQSAAPTRPATDWHPRTDVTSPAACSSSRTARSAE